MSKHHPRITMKQARRRAPHTPAERKPHKSGRRHTMTEKGHDPHNGRRRRTGIVVFDSNDQAVTFPVYEIKRPKVLSPSFRTWARETYKKHSPSKLSPKLRQIVHGA